MSEADPDAVTVSADGIKVRKTVDANQFEMLAVVFDLVSEREGTALVKIVDPVPEQIPLDDVEFQSESSAEQWTIQDGCVIFEHELAAAEICQTLYTIQDAPAEYAEAILTEPDIELLNVKSELPEDVINGGRSEVIRKFVAGEAEFKDLQPAISPSTESSGGGNESPEDEPGHIVEEASAISESADDEELRDKTEVAGSQDNGRRPESPLTGGVVRVLIKELQESDIDPNLRRLLYEEFQSTAGTTMARLTHLQKRVNELEEYADALDRFVNNREMSETVMGDVRKIIEDFAGQVRSFDQRIEEAKHTLSTLDSRFESVDINLDSLRSRAEQLEVRLKSIQGYVETAEERTDDNDVRLEDIASDMDRIEQRVADLGEATRENRDGLEMLQQKLQMDLREISQDLDDFDDFRKRLTSVFGDT